MIYAGQDIVRIAPVNLILPHAQWHTMTPSQPINKHETQRTIRSHTIETSRWYSELQPMMQQPPPSEHTSIYYWSLSADSTTVSGTKFRLEVTAPVTKTKDFIS